MNQRGVNQTVCKCAPTASSSCCGGQTTNVAPLNPCRKHQSPNGYHYVWSPSLQKCVLVNDVTGVIVDQSAPMPITLTNTATDYVNQAKSFVQNNPLLSIAIGFGVYSYFSKKR